VAAGGGAMVVVSNTLTFAIRKRHTGDAVAPIWRAEIEWTNTCCKFSTPRMKPSTLR
jgi:hypothetical protein